MREYIAHRTRCPVQHPPRLERRYQWQRLLNPLVYQRRNKYPPAPPPRFPNSGCVLTESVKDDYREPVRPGYWWSTDPGRSVSGSSHRQLNYWKVFFLSRRVMVLLVMMGLAQKPMLRIKPSVRKTKHIPERRPRWSPS